MPAQATLPITLLLLLLPTCSAAAAFCRPPGLQPPPRRVRGLPGWARCGGQRLPFCGGEAGPCRAGRLGTVVGDSSTSRLDVGDKVHPHGWSGFEWDYASRHRGYVGGAVAHLDQYGLVQARRSAPLEAYAAVRVLLFAIVLFGCATLMLLPMGLALPLVRRWDPHRRLFMERACRLWGKVASWPFFRVQVVNRESLPRPDDGKAYVYIANHQSFMDIPSMYWLNRPIKWVSKASVFKIPAIGWAMRLAGHVALQREDRRSQVETVRKSIGLLKRGANMFFFPEGTRSTTGRIGQFKKGAFSIAQKAKVGIVPITVVGTGEIMPASRLRLFPSSLGVKLVVHPTIPAEVVEQLSADELMDLARRTVSSALPPALQDPPFFQDEHHGSTSNMQALPQDEHNDSIAGSVPALPQDEHHDSSASSMPASPQDEHHDPTASLQALQQE